MVICQYRKALLACFVAALFRSTPGSQFPVHQAGKHSSLDERQRYCQGCTQLGHGCFTPSLFTPTVLPKPRASQLHPVAHAATAGTSDAEARFWSKPIPSKLPGVAAVAALALAADQIASLKLLPVSPLLYATLTGLVVGNTFLAKDSSLGSRGRALLKPGVAFAKARMLRMGIILYGFKVSVHQIMQLGPGSFLSAFVMVFSTLILGNVIGVKALKLDRTTALLVTTGASICGVSAVMAAAPVVEKDGASGSKVSSALATVLVFGLISMFSYPLLWSVLPWSLMSAKAMGIYTGATVYEVAGVVAAGNAMSPDVASAALVTKLVRVLLLAPFLIALNKLALKGESASNVQTPWFAWAFFGVCILSSVTQLPPRFVAATGAASSWLTACAMVGLGFESDVKSIRQMGWRPMLLASLLFAYLAGGGLLIVRTILHFLPA